MSEWRRSRVTLLILSGALAAYYAGWRLLWFLTDDAYIAFRYASNSQLGFGYVWNAPPFLPVEGYTSFLWVVLLDTVWSWLGVEPPDSSNWLAFAFGLGTLVLTSLMTLQLHFCEALRTRRNWFLAVALTGMVTNFSSLMWSSSGLETSLFNFLVAAWVAAVLYLPPASWSWVLGVSLTAGLLSLTRPDGLLVVAASGVLIAWVALADKRLRRLRLLGAAPLAIPLLHVLWRHAFYGEWLPNTYYAKHVAAWPEAGLRYFLSYVLEYGLWFWLLLGVTALLAGWRRRKLPRGDRDLVSMLCRSCVVATLVAHVGYYTLRVGGDHFEYRVYSHTVPLVLVSAVWMTNRLVEVGRLSARISLALPALVVALSWPIPWSIWARAQEGDSRRKSFNVTVSMAESFPAGTRWYAETFDALQRWLIQDHAICKRYQEHKVFRLFEAARYPRERKLAEEWHREHRVYSSKTVGVAGWMLARAHLIDEKGLNDYVIARNSVDDGRRRRMAHDRQPPPGYLDCYGANRLDQGIGLLRRATLAQLARHETPDSKFRPKRKPATAEGIETCEYRWRAKIQAKP